MIPLSGDETVRRVFPVFFLLLGLGCVCVCVRPVGTKQEVWVGRPSSLNKYTFPRERQWTIKLLPLVLFPAPSPPSSFVLFSTPSPSSVFSSGEDIHRTDRAHLLKKQPKRVLLAGSRVSVALPFSRLSLSFNGGRAIRVFRVNVCGPLRGRAERAFFFVFLHSHFDAYNGVVGGLRLDETERGIGENGMEGGKADELCLGGSRTPDRKASWSDLFGAIYTFRFTDGFDYGGFRLGVLIVGSRLN